MAANPTVPKRQVPPIMAPQEFPERAHLNAPQPETVGTTQDPNTPRKRGRPSDEWEELGTPVSGGLRGAGELSQELYELARHYLLYKRKKKEVLSLVGVNQSRKLFAQGFLEESAPLLAEELFPKKEGAGEKEKAKKRKLTDGKKKALKDLKEKFQLAWDEATGGTFGPKEFEAAALAVKITWEDGDEAESEKILKELRSKVDKAVRLKMGSSSQEMES